MWVTQGIKRSSNHKNKLYKKWLCSHDPDDELKYKNYLRVFKQVFSQSIMSVILFMHDSM